jgi:hypothetical protein
LVNHLMRRNIQSLKNCAASVATASTSPDAQTGRPKDAEHRGAAEHQRGISGMPGNPGQKLYAPYAPTAKERRPEPTKFTA